MMKRGPAASPEWITNVVILACAVDAADKVLLPATFKAIDAQLHLGPSRLAALTFAQSISFSLALPVWGSLMRYYTAQDLMICGCFLWSAITFMLACTSLYPYQLLLRFAVGFALASVMPLGQAIICDVVEERKRGNAFGWMQGVSSALSMFVSFAATSMSAVDIFGFAGWRVAHVVVACFSLMAGLLLNSLGQMPATMIASDASWLSEQSRVLKAVGGKPSFYIMVAQGVTGGIPWNAFAFLTFYFQLSGYTDVQAGQVMLLGGIGGIFGSIAGGKLGDCIGAHDGLLPIVGRCAVAQTSVVLGTAVFLWMINIPYSAHSFPILLTAFILFHSVSCWTPCAALRPICSEIFRNSQDRAQVLALWIALEGIIASFCGAPLVGVLSEVFGYRLSHDGSAVPEGADRQRSVEALRRALIGVSIVPWALCALAWVPMYWTYPRDRLAKEVESPPSGKGEGGPAPAIVGEQTALKDDVEDASEGQRGSSCSGMATQ